MFDIGFSKLLMIGGIALVVIGPERLPRVARTVGTMLGRAQRYVTEVKSEVNRSIELEELQRMKQEFETSARDVEQSFSKSLNDTSSEIQSALSLSQDGMDWSSGAAGYEPPPPTYLRPNKKWRVKRSAIPQWYKRRAQTRCHVQSGAARVARHRPRP